MLADYKRMKKLIESFRKEVESTQNEIAKKLNDKIDNCKAKQDDLWQTFSEGLVMHVKEMEAEARKTRLFTDSRFKLKSDQSDKTIKGIEEECRKKIALIEVRAEEAGNAVKYRLDDFKLQLESRVTQDYVEVIGRHIKNNIIDSVSAILNDIFVDLPLNFFAFSLIEKTRILLKKWMLKSNQLMTVKKHLLQKLKQD